MCPIGTIDEPLKKDHWVLTHYSATKASMLSYHDSEFCTDKSVAHSLGYLQIDG